jgi:Fe2+ or Zn2+ uptake regulation protein
MAIIQKKEREIGITITDVDKQETLDKCYFIHSKETNTSSSTICANCGKQKIFHNKFLSSRLESLLKKNNLSLKEVINYSHSKLKELRFGTKSINELQSLK